MPLGVGCAMWSNRDWVGTALPVDTPAGRELEAYAKVCNAVEGNTTFYGLPAPSTVDRWCAATEPGFRFVMKLPRTITHDRRLRDSADLVSEFCTLMAPLADRLGPVLVQLPASFAPSDLGVLSAFLDRTSGEFAWSVEVRHAGFHAGGAHERALNDALHERGVNRVIFDSRPVFAGPCDTPEEQEAFAQKPRLPVRAVATSDQPIVRFIGQTDPGANPPFWQPWVTTVARWIADGRRPIVFLHTPDNVVAPSLCRAFHAEVVDAAGIAPLPDLPPITRTPRLLTDY